MKKAKQFCATERKNLSQPADLWRACEDAAHKAGFTLSEWLAELAMAALPRNVVARLGARRRRGRQPAQPE